jgi:hypothetical protein
MLLGLWHCFGCEALLYLKKTRTFFMHSCGDSAQQLCFCYKCLNIPRLGEKIN